jgi:hypothetical protein
MEVVMKLFKITVAMVLLLAASVAVAGKGGPIISGYWEGSGQAIYPDGTIADIVLVQALLSQNGNFIHGGRSLQSSSVTAERLRKKAR